MVPISLRLSLKMKIILFVITNILFVQNALILWKVAQWMKFQELGPIPLGGI